MEALFLKLVNMSINASWLVLAVLALRFVLKKAPKSILCTLWALVALRLVVPVSFKSIFSLIPSAEPLPEEFLYAAAPQFNTGIGSVDQTLNPIIAESLVPAELASANPTQILSFVFSQLWVLGMVLMLLYLLVSYIAILNKVKICVQVDHTVRLCDHIDSPFILGIIRPRIYLPSDLDSLTAAHVLAHEQAHLKRRDHWWKPLGFLLLSVYWFNPVLWLAYILLCRDIEQACDEKVVRELDLDGKKAYAMALLQCSAPRKLVTACPLAFGEVGVKKRIKSVLHYKKPAFWIVLAAVITSIVVAVCFLTDPIAEPKTPEPQIATDHRLSVGTYAPISSETEMERERNAFSLAQSYRYEVTEDSFIVHDLRSGDSTRYGVNWYWQGYTEADKQIPLMTVHRLTQPFGVLTPLLDNLDVKYQYISENYHLLSQNGAVCLVIAEKRANSDLADWRVYSLVADHPSLLPPKSFPEALERIDEINAAEAFNRSGDCRPGFFNMTEEETAALREILSEMPKDAFTPRSSMPDIYNYYIGISGRKNSSNSIWFNFSIYYDYEHILLVWYDKYTQQQEVFEITYAPLQDFLESMMQPERIDNYTVMIDLDNPTYVSYAHEDVTIQLVRVAGWEYEIVPYVDNHTDFGIRCKPEWMEDWLFFGYMQGELVPESTFLHEAKIPDSQLRGAWHYLFQNPIAGNVLWREWPEIWKMIYRYADGGTYYIYNEGAFDERLAEHDRGGYNYIEASFAASSNQIEIITGNTVAGESETGYVFHYPGATYRPLSDLSEEIRTMEDYRLVTYDSWQQAEEALGITLIDNTFLSDKSVTKARTYNLKGQGIPDPVHCCTVYEGLDNRLYRATVRAAYYYHDTHITVQSVVICAHPAISSEEAGRLHESRMHYSDGFAVNISQEQCFAANDIPAVIVTVDRSDRSADEYVATFFANGASYQIRATSKYDNERAAEAKEALIEVLQSFVF